MFLHSFDPLIFPTTSYCLHMQLRIAAESSNLIILFIQPTTIQRSRWFCDVFSTYVYRLHCPAPAEGAGWGTHRIHSCSCMTIDRQTQPAGCTGARCTASFSLGIQTSRFSILNQSTVVAPIHSPITVCHFRSEVTHGIARCATTRCGVSRMNMTNVLLCR